MTQTEILVTTTLAVLAVSLSPPKSFSLAASLHPPGPVDSGILLGWWSCFQPLSMATQLSVSQFLLGANWNHLSYGVHLVTLSPFLLGLSFLLDSEISLNPH